MKLHQRVMQVQIAGSEFGLAWLKLDQSPADTYAALNLAFNVIDRFWIEADLKGLEVPVAAEQWESVALEGLPEPLREFTRSIGRELATEVLKNQLTYGEIMSILAEARMSNAKHHIRSERHPNNPSQPGGLA